MVELVKERSGHAYQAWCLEHQYDVITGKGAKEFFGEQEWISLIKKWVKHFRWVRRYYSDFYYPPHYLTRQYREIKALLKQYQWKRFTYYLNFIWVNQTPLLPP